MPALLISVAALAVFAVLAALGRHDAALAADTARAAGANFLLYRGAVAAYYEAAPEAGPIIPNTALPLPPGYRFIRQWQNLKVAGGAVYVYGPAPGPVLAALVDDYGARLGAVGRVQGGRLLAPTYADLGVSVPAAIPDGSIAGLIELN